MGWCACSRKCTRCLGSRGGDADGWSASASILCIPLQPHSSKALPRFSGDVYTCVVGAKSWQLSQKLAQHCPRLPMAQQRLQWMRTGIKRAETVDPQQGRIKQRLTAV